MIRKAFLLLIATLPFLTIQAQTQDTFVSSNLKGLADKMNRHNVLNTVEIGANIGTTGLGLEIATPVTDWVKVRAGVDFMPEFKIPMHFGMESFTDGAINNKFDRIQEMMYNLTGFNIDKEVKMESKPTMTTFRCLIDVYPFKQNRHWHLTAGFFVGGSSMGTSINALSEMPSLLALNMYDRMYKRVSSEDYLESVIDEPIYGDIYLDPEIALEFQEKVLSMGELGIHVGDHKDGTPYLMLPDKDGTVRAKAKVHRFRPYVGFGYGGALSSDGKWQASFDAGVQFWGGVPEVTTHDGTVLNDLINLRGKLKDYMGFMKCLPVYPSIAFRISYRF
ncbi:MAG: hypothetical protein K2K93_06255 [Muribaculaceae bacterium]|nr:hypothetical protein [Muribaculaceae bacterium]